MYNTTIPDDGANSAKDDTPSSSPQANSANQGNNPSHPCLWSANLREIVVLGQFFNVCDLLSPPAVIPSGLHYILVYGLDVQHYAAEPDPFIEIRAYDHITQKELKRRNHEGCPWEEQP